MGFLDDIAGITATTKNAAGYILKVNCQIYLNYFTCGYCKASQVNKVSLCHNCHGVFEYYKVKVGGSYTIPFNPNYPYNYRNNQPPWQNIFKDNYYLAIQGSTAYIGTETNCGFCKRWVDYNDFKCSSCQSVLLSIEKSALPVNYKQKIPLLIIEEYANMSSTSKVYNIRIQSPFILTPLKVKELLGIGYKVLEVNIEKESKPEVINNIDSAVSEIVKAGYRALALAHHPDLGGDTNTMVLINKAKKELLELLESVKV